MLAVSVSWAAAFPFPLLSSQSSGSFSENLLAQSSPLGPTAHSLASKLHLPPTHSICTVLSYSLGNGQAVSLLLTEKKGELIQNGITWSKRCSLLTYASSVWSSSLAMLNSFWGSVHWKNSYKLHNPSAPTHPSSTNCSLFHFVGGQNPYQQRSLEWKRLTHFRICSTSLKRSLCSRDIFNAVFWKSN